MDEWIDGEGDDQNCKDYSNFPIVANLDTREFHWMMNYADVPPIAVLTFNSMSPFLIIMAFGFSSVGLLGIQINLSNRNCPIFLSGISEDKTVSRHSLEFQQLIHSAQKRMKRINLIIPGSLRRK